MKLTLRSRRITFPSVLVVLAVPLWPSAAAAQVTEWSMLPSRIVAQVVDADRRSRPVSDVVVRLVAEDGVAFTGVSGRDGRLELEGVPPGRYRLVTEHVAFAAIEEEVVVDGSGRAHLIELRVARQAIALDPVVVRVAPRPPAGILQPVYDRVEAVRLWGGGTVFTREDIERRNPSQVTFMLSQVRGVRVEQVRTGGGRSFPLVISTRAQVGAGLCPMSVYVDGVRVVTGGIDAALDVRAMSAAVEFLNIDSLLRPLDVEAIEVYHPGGRIPPEFWGSYSGCGVILAWTRR